MALNGVEDALSILKTADEEETAMTAIWTLSKLAEADEANLGHIYTLGEISTKTIRFSDLLTSSWRWRGACRKRREALWGRY